MKACHVTGASQGFGRGDQEYFFSDLGICMLTAKRHAAHGEAMRIARGFGGMLPREIF